MRTRTKRATTAIVGATALGVLVACTASETNGAPAPSTSSTSSSSQASTSSAAPTASTPVASSSSNPVKPGVFTIAFAGDVHFSGRVGTRLAANPATVFGPAAAVLGKADLTMVNLETAITTGGSPAPKQFHFRAPATAFTALRDAGIDVVTMANNHGADYGSSGLQDTLTAIAASHFPVVGIGKNAAAAFAPYETTINGQKIAILAASQVEDETLARYSAGTSSPGIVSAYSTRLIDGVKAATAASYLVIVYLHWGIEYTKCPDVTQENLASALDKAGATAVIGTHVHEFQGAGWTKDGAYVAYGLGNYLWWMSFGNIQDDNGVLTLTFDGGKVTGAKLSPSRLDNRGIPVPATGTEATRILNEWNGDRGCTGLLAHPPI